jgi:hypothetical protein
MNATDFFQNQLLTDASSVIDKTRQKYSRNDLIKFAEAYHKFKLENEVPVVTSQIECDICKRHPGMIVQTQFGTFCPEHARYV